MDDQQFRPTGPRRQPSGVGTPSNLNSNSNPNLNSNPNQNPGTPRTFNQRPLSSNSPYQNRRPISNGPASDQTSSNLPYNDSAEEIPAPNPSPEDPYASLSDHKSDVVIKPRKKGPIIALVSILIVALLGGGGFALAYMISNQPTNIVMSSIKNLLEAKQAKLDGTIDIEIKNPSLTSVTNSTVTAEPTTENTAPAGNSTTQNNPANNSTNQGATEVVTETTNPIGLKAIKLNFDSNSSESGNSAEGKLSATLTDDSEISVINFSEVMMKDGKLYLKIAGLEEFFTNYFQSILSVLPASTSGSTTSVTQIQTTCVNADDPECINSTDTITSGTNASAAINSAVISEFLSNFGSVISVLDDQWLEISIDEVMSSKMLSTLDSASKQEFSKSYNCLVDQVNNINRYSNELSEAYGKNPFFNMTPGKDSYYNISLDSNNLKNFVSAIAQSKFSSDLKDCSNSFTGIIDSLNDQVSRLERTPTISAKFDGLFSHRITNLKVSDETDSYALSSDLKFSYPNNLNISAPSNTRPVMEVVEEIFTNLQGGSPAVTETVEATDTSTDATTVVTPAGN